MRPTAQINGACDAQLAHIGLHVLAQYVDKMCRAIRVQSAKRIVPAPSHHHKVRAKRDGAQDVETALNPAVENQGHLRCRAHPGQNLYRGGGGVKLPAGMV